MSSGALGLAATARRAGTRQEGDTAGGDRRGHRHEGDTGTKEPRGAPAALLARPSVRSPGSAGSSAARGRFCSVHRGQEGTQ